MEEDIKDINFYVMPIEEQIEYDCTNHIEELVKKAISVKYKDIELKTLQKIIEKQNNELERLQKENRALQIIVTKDLTVKQNCMSTFCGVPIATAMELVTDSIPKQAIRDKIEELKSHINTDLGQVAFKNEMEYTIRILEKLVEKE